MSPDSADSSEEMKRRAVLAAGAVGASTLAVGGAAGYVAGKNGMFEAENRYPYWTENWRVEGFGMQSDRDYKTAYIQFDITLTNTSDRELVWPGALWAERKDGLKKIERVVPARLNPGETKQFWPLIEAEEGEWEGGIYGVSKWDTEVTVDGPR